jgi:hypothetical protein
MDHPFCMCKSAHTTAVSGYLPDRSQKPSIQAQDLRTQYEALQLRHTTRIRYWRGTCNTLEYSCHACISKPLEYGGRLAVKTMRKKSFALRNHTNSSRAVVPLRPVVSWRPSSATGRMVCLKGLPTAQLTPLTRTCSALLNSRLQSF